MKKTLISAFCLSLSASSLVFASPDVAAFLEQARTLPVAAANQAKPAPPAAQSPDAAPKLPSKFRMYERFFAFTDTFDIKTEADQLLGTVTERFISLTKSFTYTDANRNKLAEARARFFALGSTVDVTDAQGRKLGTIKEDILKSLFKVYTTYKIMDAQDRVIATSEKVEWLSTEIVLRDPQGRTVAVIRRDFGSNFFRLTDRWDIAVTDDKTVDSRMLVMISAYKSSVDNDRRKEESRRRSDD